MNLDDITVGIAQALYGEFGDDYTIYSDQVEQGLKTPCFLIFPVSSSREHVIGNRYEERLPYDIHYFPQKRNHRSELNEVLGRLYGALEYITVLGSLIRGKNMNAQVTEGVLHFFVDYDRFLIKQEAAAEKMEDLIVKVDRKNDTGETEKNQKAEANG